MHKPTPLFLLLLACILSAPRAARAEVAKPANLLTDASFEQVREVVVACEPYIYNAIVKEGINLGNDGAPVVVLPAALSQFSGCKKLQVVEGDAGKEVHSGKRAILVNGSIYLNARSDATTGDAFKARVYVKGKGKFRVILHLTNAGNQYFGQSVPNQMPVDASDWTLVEQTLTTDDKPNLKTVWARIETVGDLYLDDFELVKEQK
ncbi:MAG: hypothetical protein AUJ92_07335 [Armatimonadetes bacterium CG2_30_59_28]|nr:hypothetical protein [Armatimonadota bacterium]OIO95860.1 MAG: hypothetical protein AUJ92_07335 [Armatimonadetes bacterium CG2_30_59_28]PIU64599.1 MAG: hypothetical protein COS85_11940 [Armatimonadetes bacterium CG07_land_8_20_14_0_80_59_28]PIX42785.1 MAG: hypothetical protein COZ56_08545 [Armatimonadetes bacterium CG_4_8_14_3_um_filter_58_9]PIY43616.1 MAG: hypothetical protein COZ05_10510 [Armatimonadetes bacterium CG_4_10_14_3_um_filter_59_10]PJB71456.1 MAG: hypothetical protein CO095_080